MKKFLTRIAVPAALVAWLQKTIDQGVAPPAGIEDLREGLSDIQQGRSDGLLIDIADGLATETAVPVITCKDLVIDPRARKVWRAGIDISLTPKEFDILYFLAKNRGEVFTKEQIYQAVWGEEYLLDSSNIMAFIRKLRKKLEPSPDAPEYILTIWGIGYKFTDET